jgi:hypothetical protein
MSSIADNGALHRVNRVRLRSVELGLTIHDDMRLYARFTRVALWIDAVAPSDRGLKTDVPQINAGLANAGIIME